MGIVSEMCTVARLGVVPLAPGTITVMTRLIVDMVGPSGASPSACGVTARWAMSEVLIAESPLRMARPARTDRVTSSAP